MPTKRTIQQLYDLFQPGQPPRSITPGMVQDLILSLRPGYGSLSLVSSALTDIPAVNDWVKLAGVTELRDGAFTFSMPQNNRLQCNCPVPSIIRFEAAITLTNGSQKDFQLAIAKNGAVMDDTIQAVRFGPGGGSEEVVLLGDFLQAQNDYIEVFVRNVTDATDITATRFFMRAMTFVV
jgi:hypothetical protein